jgi:hypothetical protein
MVMRNRESESVIEHLVRVGDRIVRVDGYDIYEWPEGGYIVVDLWLGVSDGHPKWGHSTFVGYGADLDGAVRILARQTPQEEE